LKGRGRLEEMTWEEARSIDGVILPMGSMEQHGLHLPLGTDGIIAQHVCQEVGSLKDLPVCPTLFFGFSREHAGFPGTIDLGLNGFLGVAKGLIRSLRGSFSSVMVINFHGGNSSALEALIRGIDTPGVHLLHFWRAARGIMESMTDQGKVAMEHAGEFETSLMLFLRPDLVRKGKDLGPEQSIPLKGGRIYSRAWHSEEMTPTGTFGGGKWATPEKGEEFFRRSCSKISEIIDEIMEGSSDDELG